MRTSFFVLLALLVVGLLSLASCGGPKETAEGYPIYNTQEEYAQAEDRAVDLFESILPKLDTGEELTEEDRATLREAAKISEGIKADDTRFNAYYRLGQIYFALNDLDKAIERFSQYIAIAEPKNELGLAVSLADAHFLIASSHFVKKEYEQAEKEVDLALKEFPETTSYLHLRARVYVQQKRIDKAKADLIKVIRLDPRHKDAKVLLDFLNPAKPDE